MVWFVVAAFFIFLIGLAIIVYDIPKLGHQGREPVSSHQLAA